MKRVKIIGVFVLAAAVVVAVLINNKSKLEAKSKDSLIESYSVIAHTVGKDKVTKSLEMIGTITADNDVDVVAESQGRVTGVFAKIGNYREKGSVLIQLDGELKLAALKTAEINYEKTKRDYERYEALYNQKSLTVSRLEAAKLELQAAESQFIAARKEYNNTKITAPISGIVTSRMVDEGDYVHNGMVVSNLADMSNLKVKLNVAEKDAFRLKPGDRVEIKTEVYPGVAFNGRIESISAQGDAAHTYPVEISFKNSREYPLKSGMFGRVSFTSITNGESLVIPREALVGSVKNPSVFIIKNGLAEERKIIIGAAYDSMLEVLNGLKEGEVIVTNGQNNLKENTKVTIIEQ